MPKKRRASKADLQRQRTELVELRGDCTQKEWAEDVLGVPVRTYIRYELGERRAPEPTMRLARLEAGRRKK